MSYYSDEETNRVHIRHERSPGPVHYVEARRERPTSRAYYQDPFHGHAVGHDRTMVTTTRIRDKSRERPSPPVVVAPPVHMVPQLAPVVINNTISDRHHHPSSSDEESIISSHHHHRGRSRHESQVSYRHHSHSHSHSHSRSRAGSDAYMTQSQYEMERRLDDMRRQLELLRTAGTHNETERQELDRLRRKYHALEDEAEEREQRAQEAEVMMLRRDKAELLRRQAEERAHQVEAEQLGLIKSQAELRDLKERQIREQRAREAEDQRAHDLEDWEGREARRKLQFLEQRNRLEKEANERARDAKTQAELKSAKDELDRSEFEFLSFCLPANSTVVVIDVQHHPVRQTPGICHFVLYNLSGTFHDGCWLLHRHFSNHPFTRSSHSKPFISHKH